MIEQRNNSNKDNCMKINIIKPSDGEESINNIKSPNLLSLNLRTQKRKKSGVRQKMENSLCTKKYTNEHGTHGANILKEYHKSKTIIKPNAKESSSNLENNTLTDNCSKNVDEQKSNMSQNQDISQNQDTSQNQSPSQNQKIQNRIQNHNAKQEIKHNINYNININNSNPNDLLNILKLTNNIYSGESHLQKEIPTKKLNINNLTKLDNNFNNNDSTKNKLIIQFGLKNKDRKSFKSSKNVKSNIKKTSFSNYLNLKGDNEDEMVYENKIESSESDENNKINEHEHEHNNTHNFIIGNTSSKSEKNSLLIFNKPKRKKSRSKFKSDKNKKVKNKIKKESSKNTRKSSKSNKTNKDINKDINKINNIAKNQINTIKEEDNNEENKIENSNIKNNNENDNEKNEEENKKKKKNKFRLCSFFCCLNSE